MFTQRRARAGDLALTLPQEHLHPSHAPPPFDLKAIPFYPSSRSPLALPAIDAGAGKRPPLAALRAPRLLRTADRYGWVSSLPPLF